MGWRDLAVSAVFERMPLGVAVAETSGLVVYVNPALRRILELEPGPWVPRFLAGLRAPGSIADVVVRRDVDDRGRWQDDAVLVKRGGSAVPVRESVFRLDAGLVFLHVHFFEDRTAAERVRELEALAYFDGLTGLPNRNLLGERLQRAMRDGRAFALMYVDLDGLKAVNDGIGHHAGDELLRAVAYALVATLTPRDTVARLGGDEFVVIADGVDERDAAAAVAGKLLGACRRVFPAPPYPHISASIGIAFFPRHGGDADALLARADAALYEAKARGRDGYVFAKEARARYGVERVRQEAQRSRPVGRPRAAVL